MTGKYLITTDCWFVAPDGKQYKSVFGEVQITDDTILGIKTNARSSNWFAKVGNESNHVIIAGCQIHYAVKCDSVDKSSKIEDYTIHEGKTVYTQKPSSIYIIE